MNGKKEHEEPTMEEILASIRRIISEEGEERKPEAPAAAKSAPAQEDVLELTDVIEEPAPAAAVKEVDEPVELADDIEEVAHAFAVHEEVEATIAPSAPEPELSMEEVPMPAAPLEAEAEAADAFEDEFDTEEVDDAVLADIVDPAEEVDAIMSPEEGQKVSASFDKLSELLVAGYEGYDKTLEGMVREMLRPMLKTWLDENLPAVVERVVAREVARLSRVKRP
ncbi:MAG: DUF2497 domain-containing protein [Sphingomonadales bacterium]|nr:DUF2497 domain-containing protein [Sphingomonadales bacterium]